ARLEQPTAGAPAGRAIPLSGGQKEQRVTLDTAWAEATFVLNAPSGTSVDVSVDSSAAVLSVLSPYGDVELDTSKDHRGRPSGTIDIKDDGPYFVVVSLDEPGSATLHASASLAPLTDPD